MAYTIGLDYGTNSARAVVVRLSDGAEVATEIATYSHGEEGILLDRRDPNVARQHPADYLEAARRTVRAAVQRATEMGVKADEVIALGVDTTGSTPLPIMRDLTPLAMTDEFADNMTAMAWLWKDHSSTAEAEAITTAARKDRPRYLAKTGGVYSSEWLWAKVWRAWRDDPTVVEAADTWMEIADWIPATLCGIRDAASVRRSVCAAGHKGMFHSSWGGYPDEEFLASLEPALAAVRRTLPDEAWGVEHAVGTLDDSWADAFGLRAGIPVAVGAFDAHLGAVGSGIKAGRLVKIVGTSTCDIMVASDDGSIPDIPGISGIVPGSVLPGYLGIEAGQSAVGDIFNWFVNVISPGGREAGSHEALTAAAETLRPGESGLLALDWHNGNRTVLVDQRLTGTIVGLTLHSTPGEIYRALVEATAFGARRIIEQIESYGQKIDEVVNCGGISIKNTLVMQTYADVLNRPMKISRSTQTPALGSAIAAAVVAGGERGGYDDFDAAMDAMTGTMERVFEPIPAHVAVYERLYRLYRAIHDAFGVEGEAVSLFHVMKELLDIRNEERRS